MTTPLAQPRDEIGKRPALSRRAALLIAGGIFALLALGWLADAAGYLAPAPLFTNGQAQPAGTYSVALSLDPSQPHAGAAQVFSVRVRDARGHAVSGQWVSVTLSMPPMDMPPSELPVTAGTDGGYTARGVFPMAGLWTITVRIAGTATPAAETSFVVRVKA